MSKPTSLKKKSVYALAIYLMFLITIVGTVSYRVIEPLVREQLKEYLDLRTDLIADQIQSPMIHAQALLESISQIGSVAASREQQIDALSLLFASTRSVAVSGGLWPEPFAVDDKTIYQSIFFNRTANQQIERVYSWDNPMFGGYDKETWYRSVYRRAPQSLAWSTVYIDAFTSVQMITLSMPYYREHGFAGVATIDISLNDLVKYIRKTAVEYHLGVLLKDSYGDVITEHDFYLQNDAYISQYQFPSNGWTLYVVSASDPLDTQLLSLVSKVEASVIPIMLLCVMGGYYLISRRLITPITQIAKQAEESARGGVIDIGYHSQDEILQLIESFNNKTKHLELEKIKAQTSTNVRSEFLARLSHEIRTPMNGILGTAQILFKSELKPEQQELLKTLYDSGEHMMTLLNEILDFSKIEQGKMTVEEAAFPFQSLINSINNVYRPLCHDKGLAFEIRSSIPDYRWYRGDKARLRQILFNLLNNAVKFTFSGRVEVVFSEQCSNHDSQLTIQVMDSGIGIPQQALKRIFNPFEQAESSTTRRFGGTGLGLSIVKQLCELMNGQVVVESELDSGTTFTVTIRLGLASPSKTSAQRVRKVDGHGLNALIVEDNRTNAMIMENFLTSRGFQCECVSDGSLALKHFSQASEQDRAFDLVVMDNHMPVMDGIEATKLIRQLADKHRSVLILGCSADMFENAKQRMFHAGIDGLVPKPFSDVQLGEVLFENLDKLFQYKPHLLPEDDHHNIEQLLIALYIANEERSIERLTVLVSQFQQQLAESSPAIKERLSAISSQLLVNQLPDKDDLDALTLLLEQYCR